jgi:hypothetical protein
VSIDVIPRDQLLIDYREPQPQFKVEIKNDVIHEEEEEADAALSKVANTLRAVSLRETTSGIIFRLTCLAKYRLTQKQRAPRCS